ncbi:MAG: HEAT repeat domain-containing protein [Pirellulaceae bacterium]
MSRYQSVCYSASHVTYLAAHMAYRIGLITACCFVATGPTALGVEQQSSNGGAKTPQVAAASNEGRDAIAGFQMAPGIEAQLFAAEPMVANPVAFCVDPQGRVYVCETFRQNHGVEDNRAHEAWVDDDLAAQTVADRVAYFKKHLGDKIGEYTEQEERIRLLVDSDNDGAADRDSVFAAGFNAIEEGTGAGILVRDDNVYYTCIPRLWAFRDDNNDGQADRRLPMYDGFGVRVAFRGHDLHGLCLGQDGRLYFSVGDRGFNVETKDGRLINPETGAVFRCEQDGTHLEVFASGFRNPQELAFDDFGNLFTGDNNSDSGDLARWVHVLQGSDAGWRMAYQYFPDRGPWNREKLWNPPFQGQAAYLVPPICNFADGPGGLAAYPGTGLADHYRGNFFLCDFRGQAGLSGVRTFKMRPRGASYEMIDSEVFLWNCLVTDVDFGPDGAVYVSDWVEGWNGEGKGRIYRLRDSDAIKAPIVSEVRQLLAEGMKKTEKSDLKKLLEHVDRRVRCEAQWELAWRRDISSFDEVATKSEHQLARLHALWGLGQIARFDKQPARAAETIAKFLQDPDPEMRGLAAEMAADAKYEAAASAMTTMLSDEEPRVRLRAALAIAKLKAASAVEALEKMLAENQDEDPYLRHGGVMGLAACATESELAALSSHDSKHLRLAAVVALRRQASTELAKFLEDSDSLVVTEAARAIYDVPVDGALPALAQLVRRPDLPNPALRRALNANYRLGEAIHAEAIAKLAGQANAQPLMRAEALNLLRLWKTPAPRDRVLGMWRPLTEPRDESIAAKALADQLPHLLQGGHQVRWQAANLAAYFKLPAGGDVLKDIVLDTDNDDEQRASSLLSMRALQYDGTADVVKKMLEDGQPRVRAAARLVLADYDADTAVKSFAAAIEQGEQIEQQSAIAALARMQTESARELLISIVKSLVDGKVKDELRLDVVVAATQHQQEADYRTLLEAYYAARDKGDPLAPYRDTLLGGNAQRGEIVFAQRPSLSCLRCHKANGQGGNVGPDLSKIGGDKTREYLLESIVDPNKTIAKGFETVLVETNGRIVSGIVQSEDTETLTLIQASGETVQVKVMEIDDRRTGKSSMPDDLLKGMNLVDLRDLIEFLANQK